MTVDGAPAASPRVTCGRGDYEFGISASPPNAEPIVAEENGSHRAGKMFLHGAQCEIVQNVGGVRRSIFSTAFSLEHSSLKGPQENVLSNDI